MLISETVFDRGRPLGRILWESNQGVARFQPADPEDERLQRLAARTWPCPVKCREAVLGPQRG